MDMPVETPAGQTDLVLMRTVDVPPSAVWKAWTTPELLKQWFAPKPWTAVDCEIDLRPGGIFRTVMRSPDGEEFGGNGCYLEVVANRKLVWTDALGPGFRPSQRPFFTAVITLEDDGRSGTIYTARALHKDEDDRETHAGMGFESGWSQCLDQLVEVVKRVQV